MNYYGQRDPRWAKEKLGGSDVTIGGYGCAVTALAMLCEHAGIPTTPSTLNYWLMANEGYKNNLNLVLWQAINRYTDNRLIYVNAPKNYTGAFPQVAEVDLIPNDSDFDQHFVLMLDKDTCYDPWLNKKRLVSDFGGVKSYRIYADVITPTPPQEDVMTDKEYRDNYYRALQGSLVKVAPYADLPIPDGWADNPQVLELFTQQFTDRLTARMDDLRRVSAEVEVMKGFNKELTIQLAEKNRYIQQQDRDIVDLTEKLNARPVTQSFDWQRFTSRKWLTGLLAASIPLLNQYFGWNLSVETVLSAIAPLALFIGFEGWADAKSR